MSIDRIGIIYSICWCIQTTCTCTHTESELGGERERDTKEERKEGERDIDIDVKSEREGRKQAYRGVGKRLAGFRQETCQLHNLTC